MEDNRGLYCFEYLRSSGFFSEGTRREKEESTLDSKRGYKSREALYTENPSVRVS
jgi:hypothetical protein